MFETNNNNNNKKVRAFRADNVQKHIQHCRGKTKNSRRNKKKNPSPYLPILALRQPHLE